MSEERYEPGKPSIEQEELLVDTHASWVLAPLVIEDGVAVKLEITGAGGPTVTGVL